MYTVKANTPEELKEIARREGKQPHDIKCMEWCYQLAEVAANANGETIYPIIVTMQDGGMTIRRLTPHKLDVLNVCRENEEAWDNDWMVERFLASHHVEEKIIKRILAALQGVRAAVSTISFSISIKNRRPVLKARKRADTKKKQPHIDGRIPFIRKKRERAIPQPFVFVPASAPPAKGNGRGEDADTSRERSMA